MKNTFRNIFFQVLNFSNTWKFEKDIWEIYKLQEQRLKKLDYMFSEKEKEDNYSMFFSLEILVWILLSEDLDFIKEYSKTDNYKKDLEKYTKLLEKQDKTNKIIVLAKRKLEQL